MTRPLPTLARALAATLLAACTLPALAALDAAERAALIALYNATGGAAWVSNTGWKDHAAGSDPCDDGWTGVYCDAAHQHVTRLLLQRNGLAGGAAVGTLPHLQELDLSVNALTTLDLSGAPALQTAYAGVNQLTSVNLSGLRALTGLSLGYNQLSSVDLSDLDAIRVLGLQKNRLQGAAPVITAAQAAQLDGQAEVCPNALSVAATTDPDQNTRWQQATGHNPWDQSCVSGPGSITVTWTVDPPGSATVTPGSPFDLPLGWSQALLITPAPGFVVGSESIDPALAPCYGVHSVMDGGNSAFTLTAAEAGTCHVTIRTAPTSTPIPISVAVSGPGSHTPPEPEQTYGRNQLFSYTFTPAPGAALASVEGCGGTLEGHRYLGRATEACTISAVFRATAASAPTSVPTLSEWALMLLGTLAAALGLHRLRRRA